MDIKHISITMLLTFITTSATFAYSINNIENTKNTKKQVVKPYIQILNLNEAGQANFTAKSAKINKKGQSTLNLFVKQILTSGMVISKIVIVGHTDNIGTTNANKHLSEQRAIAVANYFTNKGLDNTLMQVTGHGETNPVANNESRMGRAQNRRVFIQIHGNTPQKNHGNFK